MISAFFFSSLFFFFLFLSLQKLDHVVSVITLMLLIYNTLQCLLFVDGANMEQFLLQSAKKRFASLAQHAPTPAHLPPMLPAPIAPASCPARSADHGSRLHRKAEQAGPPARSVTLFARSAARGAKSAPSLLLIHSARPLPA